MCFDHLSNVKKFGWNHKRVYRIYRELELNLRIKPKHRIKRDKPDALSVPIGIPTIAGISSRLKDSRFRGNDDFWLNLTALGQSKTK
ncbi:hypothetical protein THMIRHAT_08630 [Thiosulfativibrio zosterae]|uniref:HTH-like domain-containing protein n=1 Tax=Thiosulfativibrio zosterae TaxID=2675053 RepID=A0A6F8PM45_9GAMM|nr:hypothetical protein THMIRHAT_08630 [Thiosulfativibrio zosterae]